MRGKLTVVIPDAEPDGAEDDDDRSLRTPGGQLVGEARSKSSKSVLRSATFAKAGTTVLNTGRVLMHAMSLKKQKRRTSSEAGGGSDAGGASCRMDLASAMDTATARPREVYASMLESVKVKVRATAPVPRRPPPFWVLKARGRTGARSREHVLVVVMIRCYIKAVSAHWKTVTTTRRRSLRRSPQTFFRKQTQRWRVVNKGVPVLVLWMNAD